MDSITEISFDLWDKDPEQFAHLFGDEKDIPPGPFEIISVKLKPSILTSFKKLLDFLN